MAARTEMLSNGIVPARFCISSLAFVLCGDIMMFDTVATLQENGYAYYYTYQA